MKRLFILSFLMILLYGGRNKVFAASDPSDRPDRAKPHSMSFSINGPQGRLVGEMRIPALKNDRKCPMVILMHGVMASGDAPLLVAIADRLQAAGIASVRFDFNGHGKSDGEFIRMTVPNEVEDARAIYDYVSRLDFIASISLLGHSQGGVVAALLAASLGAPKVCALVLMAPAVVLEDQAREGTTLGADFDPDHLPDYITVAGHNFGKEYLSSAQKLDIIPTASTYKGPVCIVHGKNDEVVDYAYSQRMHKEYLESVLCLLENENHSFSKKTDEATRLVVDFLVLTSRSCGE